MSNDEIGDLEDLESYSPSVQRVNTSINVIAVIHVLAGILPLPIVNFIFAAEVYQTPVIVAVLLLLTGSILLASIPFYMILGLAIWKLYPWAWKIAVIANSIFLIIYVLSGIILLAMLDIVLLFALFSPDVKLALGPIYE